MAFPQLHSGIANAMLLYFLILAVWGTLTFLRNKPPSSGFWGAITIATYLSVAQAAVGAALYGMGFVPRDPTHLLYGVTAVLGFPAARLYTQKHSDRAQLIAVTLVAFFLVGVAIRGMTTGR